MAPYILDVIGVKPSLWMFVVLATIVTITHTLLNLLGVKVTAIITNLGLCVEVGMTVVLGGMFFYFPAKFSNFFFRVILFFLL